MAVSYLPGEVLLWLYHRFGPVTRMGGLVCMLGPTANQFVFANSHLFRWRDAFQQLVLVDGGDTALIVSDGEEHKRRRRALQPALQPRNVSSFVGVMADNADSALRTWEVGMVIDVHRELRSAILRSTIQSLFGRRLAQQADILGDQLHPMFELIDRLPVDLALQRRLRTPRWRRAMAARARIDERVYAEIEWARAATSTGVLGTLVHESALSDKEIRDQLVSLIAAGYETTSAAMAWAIYSLLSTPDAWQRAADEIDTVLGDRSPTDADLSELTYLNGVVREALRLCPPAVVWARKVVEDFEFDGKRIRAGSFLVFSPYVTHRLPEVWPDPLRFRPDRWNPDRPDYRQPGPHEFLPFGGGPHRCIGANMAITHLLVMLTRVVARTQLRLVSTKIRPVGLAAMRPRHALLVECLAVD